MCQKPKALWSCVLFFCKKSRVHLSKKLKPLRKAYATSLQNVVSDDYNDHNDGGGECVDSRSKKITQSNSKKKRMVRAQIVRAEFIGFIVGF